MANILDRTGNKTNQASFMDVVFSLKKNIMKNLNVADAVRITSVDPLKATLLTNPEQTILCEKLQELDVQIDDIMLVVFTNSNFITNLNKFKNEQTIQKIETELHSLDNGILVGLIYRKET